MAPSWRIYFTPRRKINRNHKPLISRVAYVSLQLTRLDRYRRPNQMVLLKRTNGTYVKNDRDISFISNNSDCIVRRRITFDDGIKSKIKPRSISSFDVWLFEP